eukprot:TRINITY_DN29938_c0_g1_i1.p1 TRINITY_DN29938_c0_g1~~TRINITY_DN29938_c0_g1_i1.p1  ORF type:complete len:224 (+),score=43.57 TRINITY_DN29938_c0_g1_i1:362-1033(+)
MNHKPGQHQVFQQNQQRLKSHPKASLFRFLDNPSDLKDPTPQLSDPDPNNNPTNRPDRWVRQQTCDLITLMGSITEADHIMLMEDDFESCPNFVSSLTEAVTEASKLRPPFLCLRVSYGMNGIVIPKADVPSLIQVLKRGVSRLPPDLLLREWMAAHKPRKMAVYKFNLLAHRGTHSSLPRPERQPFPECQDPMSNVWSLGQDEQFNLACRNRVVSPLSLIHI